jgi:cytochrome P450
MLVQLLTSALTCLALLAVYVYRLQLQRDAAANEHGCHLAVRHRSKEPFSGIDFHMEMHVDIPSLHRYHQHYGKTFQLQSLIAQPAVMTLAPINIKAVNTAKDFGIEPMRLSGMEYFCGRGFLTTDGDIWQHSRKLLKPGFAKSNLINLDFLSQQVDNILSQLPAEGDTVDLQPLLYTMVGSIRYIQGNAMLI